MSQPVKLSDGLVMEARVAGAAMQRSIAGQVEFWASLGKTMERLMNGAEVARARRTSTAASLSDSIASVNQPEGRRRLAAYLEMKPFPRFVADPLEERVFIRDDADGTRTPGRFSGREFIPLSLTERAEGR